MGTLKLAHFNDVYRVAPQKISSKSAETIDVTQFGYMLDKVRNQWKTRKDDGARDGLVLFSGDVFSPSVESSVTRGSHMVPVMNVLAPDVSLTGNHDFDFGYAHLVKLVQDTKFPWLLSNVVDTETSSIPEHLQEYQILERAGIRIGIIGLIEKDWISTISSWPSNFEYRDMETVGIDLSKRLRGEEHKCDIVIALTHARVPNDIMLAKALGALSPSAQKNSPINDLHGVDLLLGGHDHLYYVSKGVQAWDDFDYSADVLGGENDKGDILLVKSGTDFRDLSEINLEVEDTPPGSIRRKIIERITGKRHTTKPGSPSSKALTDLLKTLLGTVSKTMHAPVCKSTVALDCQSQMIRTQESASGNWFADVIRHAYDDALCLKGVGGSDGTFICAGTLRGDSVYGPGNITLGDILEILPFEDPIVVLSLDGAAIWDAMESSLSTWPAQEGRFPVISGFRVSWDSRLPPGQRVKDIRLSKEAADSVNESNGSGTSTPRLIDGPRIVREKGGRMYKMVTREYMAQGFDGFDAFKTNQSYLIDDETGQLMSTLVRRYLLGSQFVNKMSRIVDHSASDFLHASSQDAIASAKARRERSSSASNPALQQWKHAASLVMHRGRSRAHYQAQITITNKEHMSEVDPCDGGSLRKGVETGLKESHDEDLLTIHPIVDGRLKDEARD